MNVERLASKSARVSAHAASIIGLTLLLAHPLFAQEPWPPAPALEASASAADMAPLPPSVTAEPREKGMWHCTFRFDPPPETGHVVLAGSFNGWDRQALPLTGPAADGSWRVEVNIPAGVTEYKFLINDDVWHEDTLNPERVPDGFGGSNSVLCLGRLARTRRSDAKLDDGEIDPVGLEHRPTLPLYAQPLGPGEILLRYRTLAHDIRQVQLAVRDGQMLPMSAATEGPLFKFWEARLTLPAAAESRTPKVSSVEYTFVLEDGNTRVSDPYPYRVSFSDEGLFETPEWAKHAVWYQVMLDRFRNGNPNNDPKPLRPWTSAWFTSSEWETQGGQTFYEYFVFARKYGGDLDGLEQKLAYLKELGVNALYLNPIFAAPSYHKYDTISYVHIDPSFDTTDDFATVTASENFADPATWQWTAADRRFLEFLKKAHAQGFKVILDGVFNHVSAQHPAFQDVAQKGKESPYADWFEVTSWEPFRYAGWAGFAELPVFAKTRNGFASTKVRDHLFSITRRWMDPDGNGDPSDGIDGWRLDVPNEVPRAFWVEWRRYVKGINPDALITGEIWHRADQWLDGHHFDAVMNYEFAKIAVRWVFDRQQRIPPSEAAARLAELRLAYPAEATYALQNLVGSHDTDRLASMALNPDREYDRQNRVQDNNPDYDNAKPPAECYARARLVALLQMTYVGAPMIYYGDEVGMWGADDPSNRKPMLWQDLQPYDEPEEDQVMDEQLSFYRRIIAMRNEHPALQVGSFETLLTDDDADVWVFLRKTDKECVLVALNASSDVQNVAVPAPNDTPPSWRIVLGGEGTVAARDGRLELAIPALDGIVLHAPRE